MYMSQINYLKELLLNPLSHHIFTKIIFDKSVLELNYTSRYCVFLIMSFYAIKQPDFGLVNFNTKMLCL